MPKRGQNSVAVDKRPTLDWAGALTITAGLIALVYGIVESDSYSWGSGLVIGFIALGVALLAAFLVIESRHPHPLVPLRLFRSRALTGANLIMVCIGSVIFSLFFFLSQFLQEVQGYSPLKTGFAFLPMPLAVIIGTQLSSKLVAKIGARRLLVLGPILSAVGLLLLSRLHSDSSYLTHVGLPAALTSFGVGLSFVPLTLSATNGVERRDAGLASGLINTTRQIGGSLGLAALLTIAAARSKALAHEGVAVAQTAGYTRAFEVSSAVLVVAALLAATVLPRLSRPSAAVSGEQARASRQGRADPGLSTVQEK